MKEIVKRGVYKHYKGKYYLVVDEALDSETQEPMVIYVELYGDCHKSVRPCKMFLEEVDKPEYNYKGPRFKFVGELPDQK